ncbi:MAG: hypothetical protein Q3962_04315 [Corynebacterium sp.]|nr:hypothetical protein [Corynebacterium sp.]
MSLSTLFSDFIEVLIASIILGAGLPALFALGVRWISGTGVKNPDGSITHTKDASMAGKIAGTICFIIIALAIIVGILWVTQGTIYHYFGIDLFGTGGSSGH